MDFAPMEVLEFVNHWDDKHFLNKSPVISMYKVWVKSRSDQEGLGLVVWVESISKIVILKVEAVREKSRLNQC